MLFATEMAFTYTQLVRYRFYTPEEGGRTMEPPYQGTYRSDWAYDGDDISRTGIHMIWPEFLGEDGLVLPDGAQVPVGRRHDALPARP